MIGFWDGGGVYFSSSNFLSGSTLVDAGSAWLDAIGASDAMIATNKIRWRIGNTPYRHEVPSELYFSSRAMSRESTAGSILCSTRSTRPFLRTTSIVGLSDSSPKG